MKTSYRNALYAATAGIGVLAASAAYATPMILTLTATDLNNAANNNTAVFCDSVSAACTAAGGTVADGGLGVNNIIIPAGVQNGIVFSGEISSSAVGAATGKLNTTATTVKNTSLDTYVLTASLVGQNFNGPATQVTLSGSGTFDTLTGTQGNFAAITYNYFDDPSNSATPGAGQLVGTFTNPAFTNDSQSFSYNNTQLLAVPDDLLYAMSIVWTYTLLPGQELISRGITETKTNAPEPASLMLLGVGLVGLGVRRVHRRA